MRIAIEETFPDDYRQHLTGWRERVFPEEGIGKQWREVRWHLYAWDKDDLPVAHLGFEGIDITADGVPLRVAGIGGVVVRPEYQGRGVPARLFEHLHREAPALAQTDVFALFCPGRLTDYYARHGYRSYTGRLSFVQFDKVVDSRFEFMTRGYAANPAHIAIDGPPW